MTHASLLIVANYWVEEFHSGSWGGEKNAMQLGFISRNQDLVRLSCLSGLMNYLLLLKWTFSHK